MQKIQLSIQEIVDDFEKLVRYDERLGVYFENQKASDGDIEKFHHDLEEMALKYIPNYKEKLPAEYFSKDFSDYEKALEIFKMLYENFKEIFNKLV